MRDRPLSAEALDIMARATVAQMRGDAAELADLCRAVLAALPEFSRDTTERELELLDLLQFERERSRRLLALIAGNL
ncbi:hypothetical protein ACVWZV_008581 [Bradyrhizobium sp. GM5.1]|uniref:hypothetical protein n=1 Tax=Bradyrhizobium sp. CW4 TaxID=2782687 RepID=UPI001FF71270|nr:hypothetical protein [Bradyrhizobium sp. CW4]MCK1417924.1 hypothetical protein [Bradyrhizobium sp. CW4]